MRVSTFDKLSLIGGTMGLFTGISIITLIEIIYWMVRFIFFVLRKKLWKNSKGKVSTNDNGYYATNVSPFNLTNNNGFINKEDMK